MARPFLDLLPGSRWTPDNCDVSARGGHHHPRGQAAASRGGAGGAEGLLRGQAHPFHCCRRHHREAARLAASDGPRYPLDAEHAAANRRGSERVCGCTERDRCRPCLRGARAWRVGQGVARRRKPARCRYRAFRQRAGLRFPLHRGDDARRLSPWAWAPELAKNLALQTVLGSAQLASQSHHSVMELRCEGQEPAGHHAGGAARCSKKMKSSKPLYSAA